MNPDRCQATANSGKPCSATARAGRPFCVWHDPLAADERLELSRRGGAARSNAARARKQLPADPLSGEQLVSYLSVVFKGVISGRLEPRVGTAAATIAKTMVDIRGAGEVERLAAEVEDLRALLARRPA